MIYEDNNSDLFVEWRGGGILAREGAAVGGQRRTPTKRTHHPSINTSVGELIVKHPISILFLIASLIIYQIYILKIFSIT
jgi:hypothetical protein